jgi:hypothetical protein
VKKACLAALAAVALLAACGQRSADPDAAPLTFDVDEPRSAATWAFEPRLGAQLEQGEVPRAAAADTFVAGAPVYLTIDVRDTPPGAALRVEWMGPEEATFGEHVREVQPGAGSVTLGSGPTSDWPAGDYRAELWAWDERLATLPFSLGAPRR